MTIHARNRAQGWTAFTAPDGRMILNVSDRDACAQGTSILVVGEDRDAFHRGDALEICDAVDRLIDDGARLARPVPTPPFHGAEAGLAMRRAA